MADSLEDVCDRILRNRPQTAPHGHLDTSDLLEFEGVEQGASNNDPTGLLGALSDIKSKIQPAHLSINLGTPDIDLEGASPLEALPRKRRPVLRSVSAAECNSLAQFSINNPNMRAMMDLNRKKATTTTHTSNTHIQLSTSHSPSASVPKQVIPHAPLSDELRKELAEQRKLLLQLHRHQTSGSAVPSLVLDGQSKAIMTALGNCATEEDVRHLERRLQSTNRHYDSQLGSASAALVEANAALRSERIRMEEERRQWRRERTVLASEVSRHASERLQAMGEQAAIRTAQVASKSMKLVLGLERDREELAAMRHRETAPRPTEIKGGEIARPERSPASIYVQPSTERLTHSKPTHSKPVQPTPQPEVVKVSGATEAAVELYTEDVKRSPVNNAPKHRMGKVGSRPKPNQLARPGGALAALKQSELVYESRQPKAHSPPPASPQPTEMLTQDSGTDAPTVASGDTQTLTDPLEAPSPLPSPEERNTVGLPAVIINAPYRRDMDAVRTEEVADESDRRLVVNTDDTSPSSHVIQEEDREPSAFLSPDQGLQTAYHEYRARERRIRGLYGVMEDESFGEQDSTMQAVIRGVVHDLISSDVKGAVGGNSAEDKQFARLVQECLLEHANIQGVPTASSTSLDALRTMSSSELQSIGLPQNFHSIQTDRSTKVPIRAPVVDGDDEVLALLKSLIEGNVLSQPTPAEPTALPKIESAPIPHKAPSPTREVVKAHLPHGLTSRLLDGDVEVEMGGSEVTTKECALPERGGTINIHLRMDPPVAAPQPPPPLQQVMDTPARVKTTDAMTETDEVATPLSASPPPTAKPSVIEINGEVCNADATTPNTPVVATIPTNTPHNESVRLYTEELLNVPHEEDHRASLTDESFDMVPAIIVPPVVGSKVTTETIKVADCAQSDTSSTTTCSTMVNLPSPAHQLGVCEAEEVSGRNAVLKDEYTALCIIFNEHVPRHRQEAVVPTTTTTVVQSALPQVPAPLPSAPLQQQPPPTDKVTRTILDWFSKMEVVPPTPAAHPVHHPNLSSMTTSGISSTNLSSYEGRGVHRFGGFDLEVARRLGKQSPFTVPHVAGNPGGSMTTVTSLSHESNASGNTTITTNPAPEGPIRPHTGESEWWQN